MYNSWHSVIAVLGLIIALSITSLAIFGLAYGLTPNWPALISTLVVSWSTVTFYAIAGAIALSRTESADTTANTVL